MVYIENKRSRILSSPDIAQYIIIESDSVSLSYFADYLKNFYRKDCIVYFIRGKKCKSLSSLFDEWAAALQFPVYFGENLHAFKDCLGDLPRRNPTDHIIVIMNSNDLLEEDCECLSDFLEIITNVPVNWEKMFPEQSTMQFKMVFHESKEQVENLKNKLQSLNVAYDEVRGDWLELLTN
jgi:hypothetical protein